MKTIENKIVLITGGSKGIGYGIAKALVNQNAKVAVTSRTQASADQAVAELNKLKKGEVIGIAADVKNPESQQKAVDVVLRKWGKVDVLIANAGLGYFGSIE